MKKIFLMTSFLLAVNLFANDEIEGTYIAKSDATQELYELNLNVEKNSNGNDELLFHLTKAFLGDAKKIETSITGKYKINKTKIILYGEIVIDQKIGSTEVRDSQESKYTGSPIRVHVRNQDNKTILVLQAFGKTLKLEKQI